MAPYKGTKIVTYHRSWPNFMERFGLDVMGYVEPKPGIPPSPSHTLELIEEMKRQGVEADRRRAVLRPEDAAGDRRTRSAARCWCWRRRSAARRRRPTTFSCSTTTSKLLAAALKQSDGEVGRMDWTISAIPGAGHRRQPDHRRHPRVSRAARRRARRDLRRSLAGADRLARRGHRRVAGLRRARDRHIYWMSLGFTLIGAFIFAMVKGHEARHPAGSDHRHLLRGRLGGRDPHDEQGHGRGRAPAGTCWSGTSCRCSGRRSG